MRNSFNALSSSRGMICFLVSSSFLYAIYLFQRPYYFVFYDSEPDYLGNALHIVNWGFPNAAHHPATITYYFLAFILKITSKFSLSVESAILMLRLSLLGVCFLLIYFGCRLYGKKIKERFMYAVALTFLIPPINFFVDLISAEALLFGLGFVIAALSYKYVGGGYKKNYALPIFLGVALSVKLSALSLVGIVLATQVYNIHSMRYLRQSKSKFHEQLRDTFSFYLILVLTFLVLSLPVISTVANSLLNLVGRLTDDFSYLSVLGFFGAIFTGGYLLLRSRILEPKDRDPVSFFIVLSRSIILICLLLYVVYLIKILITVDSLTYSSFAIATRHLNPLLPFIFVPGFFGNVKLFKTIKESRCCIVILIISALLVKSLMSYSYAQYAETYDKKFIKLIDTVKKHSDYVMLYPSSEFISRDMFELWTTERYGNGMIDFSKTFNTKNKSELSNLKSVSYINFNDINEGKRVEIQSGKRLNVHISNNMTEFKKRIKSFLYSRRNENYDHDIFFQRLWGFPLITSVYDYALRPTSMHISSDAPRVALIIPATNIDYLSDSNTKGNYFVARTSSEKKHNYVDDIKLKLKDRKIDFDEYIYKEDGLDILVLNLRSRLSSNIK